MSHRVVQFPLTDSQLSHNGTAELVAEINSRFPVSDFEVIRNDQGYEIHLREVAIKHMSNIVADLLQDESYDAQILDCLHNAIKGQGNYGLKGDKRIYVGFNEERKVVGRKQKEIQRGRHFYANGSTFCETSNAVPESYVNRIVCGDSEEVLKNLPDNCIDLVFTSPPYNFGLTYQDRDDASRWQDYFDKLFAILDECVRVLKHGGRLAINIQPLYSDYIPSHHIISKRLMDANLIWKGEILWEKNNYNCKYTAWGSWKSPSNPYLKYTWEFIEVFCKGTLQKTGDSSDADITADDFKKWVVGKWSIAPEKQMKTFDHPAVFPEELARRVIQLFSFKGDNVLDPFAGVGTTCVVAKKFGRGFLGIDSSAQYCETARERLQEQMNL